MPPLAASRPRGFGVYPSDALAAHGEAGVLSIVMAVPGHGEKT